MNGTGTDQAVPDMTQVECPDGCDEEEWTRLQTYLVDCGLDPETISEEIFVLREMIELVAFEERDEALKQAVAIYEVTDFVSTM